MNHIQKRNYNAVAKGSLQDVARQSGLTLAEAFMSCDAVVIVDGSGSMMMIDVRPGEPLTRHQAATAELARLQAELPGKVAVIAFSSSAEFCPSGFPRYIGGGTDMAAALEFVKVADGCGIKIILISDGEPDNADATLRLARGFTSKIDTVFIGREGAPGAEFLRRLAAATGGIATRTGTTELTQLGSTVRLLKTS